MAENLYKKITNPELYPDGVEPYPRVQELNEWVNEEVAKVKKRSVKWLSEFYFHRQENRPRYIDSNSFFTPADGVIMDAREKVNAKDNLIEVKGCHLTLQDLFQDNTLQGDFLIVSVFMTFYSQHINYMPYNCSCRYYTELPPISSYNKPMLAVEKDLLNGVINPEFQELYLHKNNREISECYSSKLDQEFYIIRIGDYDVDTMINFVQKDGLLPTPILQNTAFGKIQYGSQCILAIPLYEDGIKFKLRSECKIGNVVKCRRTPIVQVCWNESYKQGEVEHVED